MCRSIVQFRRAEHDVTDAEITAAARQFVRKVSGDWSQRPPRAALDATAATLQATYQRLYY
jgi:hypothetical protein